GELIMLMANGEQVMVTMGHHYCMHAFQSGCSAPIISWCMLSFDYAGNGIGDTGASSLSGALEKNTTLTTLDLSGKWLVPLCWLVVHVEVLLCVVCLVHVG